MSGADMIVELEATTPPPLRSRPIIARLVPGLPGVRFEAARHADIVLLGFPGISDLLYFRPLDDVTAGHNAVTSALAEVIKSRVVRRVFFSEPVLWPCIRKSVGNAECAILFGDSEIQRDEFRPRFPVDRTKPGDHWSALEGVAP